MKVIQIIQFFSPKMGGSVDNAYNLSKTLIKLGHQVTVCTTDSEYDEDFAKSVPGLKVLVFPSKFGKFRYSPTMKTWLDKNVEKYDILHLNNYWSYQNIIASCSARRHNVPYIVSPKGSLHIQLKAYLSKYFFDLLFGRRVLRDSGMIVAKTPMEIKQLKRKGVTEDHIRIVANGIAFPPENLKDGKEFRQRFGIPDQDKIVLFLGRVHKIKGIDLLINAFFDVLQKDKYLKLVITGPDSGYLAEVKKRIKEKGIEKSVVITGPLYKHEKFLAYKAAAVYVLPSRYEIFGNTLLEACVCGTPVITTDRCGLAPVIDRKAGRAVRYDRNELSQAIEEILSSPELARKYSEYGKKLAREDYNWEKVAYDYLQLYEDVIAKMKKNA